MALVDKSIGEARKQIVIEMNRRPNDVFEKLIKFIDQEIPAPEYPEYVTFPVKWNCLVIVRVAEEDAEEFLSKWFAMFNIDPGDFEFPRYFPSEGL